VQKEYEEEGIDWEAVSFSDNQPVLDMIEGKFGLISLLNEELLVSGSDASFMNKLRQAPASRAPPEIIACPQCAKGVAGVFTLVHYAGPVTYAADGFLVKHADALFPTLTELVQGSASEFARSLFAPDAEPPSPGAGGSAAGANSGGRRGSVSNVRPTVGTQFRSSLRELMESVTQTRASYVRCIKPNALKSASAFDMPMVVEQLRCAGVISAIKISRSAFPANLPARAFAARFGALQPAVSGEALLAFYKKHDPSKATDPKALSKLCKQYQGDPKKGGAGAKTGLSGELLLQQLRRKYRDTPLSPEFDGGRAAGLGGKAARGSAQRVLKAFGFSSPAQFQLGKSGKVGRHGVAVAVSCHCEMNGTRVCACVHACAVCMQQGPCWKSQALRDMRLWQNACWRCASKTSNLEPS
jgi:hypothetical protein